MAASEARGMWQRTAAKCHMVQEDAIRSPKVVHCSLPRIISRSQADTRHPMGYSYYWSNSCFSPESKLDIQGQFRANKHTDYYSKLDERPNSRFSKPAGLQSLAAESASVMKSGPGLISLTSDYSAAEVELKPQFVVDPQPRSGLTTPTSELCKEDDDVTFEEAVLCDTKLYGPGRCQQEHYSEFVTSETNTESSHDIGPQGSHYGAFLSKQKNLASKFGTVSEDQDRSSRSSIRSIFWRVADKDIWAGQFAQKTIERLDNCNPSYPRARLITKADTGFDCSPSVDDRQDLSQSHHKKIIASLPCGSESHHLEKIVLASSPSLGRLCCIAAEKWHSQGLSEPEMVPSISDLPLIQGSHSFSSSYRNTQLCGGAAVTMDQGPGLFAKALCHSQTRAREAEKKVQREFEEKERLMRLFFKETYLAFTYRQWVTSLQLENMWLRMRPRHQPVGWLQHSFLNPLSALERLSIKHWRGFGLDYHSQYPMDQNLSAVWHGNSMFYLGDPNDVMMGYTLAFALGLSLAGAGLVLGWSMGWILLAY